MSNKDCFMKQFNHKFTFALTIAMLASPMLANGQLFTLLAWALTNVNEKPTFTNRRCMLKVTLSMFAQNRAFTPDLYQLTIAHGNWRDLKEFLSKTMCAMEMTS